MGFLEGQVNGPQSDDIKSSLLEDYARADVYFKTLNVQTVEERAKYPNVRISRATRKRLFFRILLNKCFQVASLFASLGGALSLYLGVAIIMCFELVELLYDVATNVWRHLNGGNVAVKGAAANCCHCGAVVQHH